MHKTGQTTISKGTLQKCKTSKNASKKARQAQLSLHMEWHLYCNKFRSVFIAPLPASYEKSE